MITQLWFFNKNQLLRRRYWRKLKIVALFIFAITMIITVTACQPCATLTIDNQTLVDITIIHEAYDNDGNMFDRNNLGAVPTGQTVKLEHSIGLHRSDAGSTVVLKAEDESGQVVWQRSWSYDEFKELEDVGWKITIPPEGD